mmetsp:Transcript_38127/g.82902  ORF Transcript_38127/g.82902 Transcript_38127/m.82902 type:complete len:225 (+) Transcript_38127:649-1323(+)
MGCENTHDASKARHRRRQSGRYQCLQGGGCRSHEIHQHIGSAGEHRAGGGPGGAVQGRGPEPAAGVARGDPVHDLRGGEALHPSSARLRPQPPPAHHRLRHLRPRRGRQRWRPPVPAGSVRPGVEARAHRPRHCGHRVQDLRVHRHVPLASAPQPPTATFGRRGPGALPHHSQHAEVDREERGRRRALQGAGTQHLESAPRLDYHLCCVRGRHQQRVEGLSTIT